MSRVKIITDSTCDLPFDLLAEREIERVPLQIILGENSYPDDQTLLSCKLFEFADSTGMLPKSAAVNAYDFEVIFRQWLEEGYDIFYTGLSGRLSSTLQNALTAAKAIGSDKISIVDSLSLSSGVGLQVLEASDMAAAGASLCEITQHALHIRDKVQASFVVDTLKYLYMGGRCSKLASIVGSRLQIKPKLELKDGEIVPGSKFRGAQFVNKYFDQVMECSADIDPKRIFVTHCLTNQAAEGLKSRLINEFGFTNVMITEASPTISTHCGPGTIGVLFIYK